MKDVSVLKGLLDSYVRHRNKRAIFVKQDKLGIYSLAELLEGAGEEYCVDTYFHDYKIHEMKSAFEPFLEWIRDMYYEKYASEFTVQEFISNAGVYSLQQDSFCAYITDGKARRVLDVMVEEYAYEGERMIKSVYSVMDYISQRKPMVLIFGRIHMAPYSVMQVINYMIKRVKNIFFVFTYDESFLVKEYCRPQWDELMETAEKGNLFLEIPGDDKDRKLDFIDEFVCREEYFDQYLQKIFNMIHMLAFKDARYYLNIIEDYVARENFKVTTTQKFYVLMAVANAEIGLSNYKNGLFSCEKMLPLIAELKDYRAEYVYNYISAKAQLLLLDSELTFKFCKKCRSLAKKLGDDKLAMNADVIETVAHFGSMREMFKCKYKYKVDESVIEKLKRYNHENFLAYVYAFAFDNDAEIVRQIANGETESWYFNKSIEIAERLDNKNLLLMAYMKNVILYSEYGYFDYVNLMYEKRLEILDRENPVRIAHAYSGLGYNCIVLEEYAKADAYLRQGVNILIDIKIAEDMAETLYNMLVNYYVAGVNDKAIECGELLFKVMNVIDIQCIQICNTSKLYGYVVLANYKKGQYYDCYYYLSKMEKVMSYALEHGDDPELKLWYGDLFMYHLCKGNMYLYEEKYDEAEEAFDQARVYLELIPGDRYYADVEYAIFASALYDKLNRQEEKMKILHEAYENCCARHHKDRAERIKAHMEGREYVITSDYAREPLPAKAILDMCEFVGAMEQIEDRDKDVNFLALCNDTMGREQNSVMDMMEEAVNIIQNSFNLDRLFLLEKKNGKCVTTYSHGTNKLNMRDCQEVFDFFEKYRMEFVSSRTEESFGLYSELIGKFDVNGIATILGVPIYKDGNLVRVFIGIVDVHRCFTGKRRFLNKHNLTIIKYAVNQLSDAIKRIMNNCMIKAMNQELAKSAVTDQLTGIYNRMGMGKIVADGISDKGVVLYLDLDYFKKYNDAYGHNIGDLILKEFAKILEGSVKNIGYAIRYGGDEFVAIIPDRDEEFGKQVARRINEEFKGNYEIQMAIEGQPISSSIGVAPYDDPTSEGLEAALKMADKALYTVKGKGKGNVCTWSEIEDDL